MTFCWLALCMKCRYIRLYLPKHCRWAVNQPWAPFVVRVYSPMIKHSVHAQDFGLVTTASHLWFAEGDIMCYHCWRNARFPNELVCHIGNYSLPVLHEFCRREGFTWFWNIAALSTYEFGQQNLTLLMANKQNFELSFVRSSIFLVPTM